MSKNYGELGITVSKTYEHLTVDELCEMLKELNTYNYHWVDWEIEKDYFDDYDNREFNGRYNLTIKYGVYGFDRVDLEEFTIDAYDNLDNIGMKKK